MTPEEAVRTRILMLEDVTDRVDSRVWLAKLPQDPVLPAVLVQLIGEYKFYHLRGGMRLCWSRVQVDAYADEADGADPYATAIAIADAMQGDEAGSGLSGWQGSIGSPPVIHLDGIFCEERRPLYEAEELTLVRMMQDFRVWSRVES
jgi:hypothetical protein